MVDFPLPDSPISASASARPTSKEIPSTAANRPPGTP